MSKYRQLGIKDSHLEIHLLRTYPTDANPNFDEVAIGVHAHLNHKSIWMGLRRKSVTADLQK